MIIIGSLIILAVAGFTAIYGWEQLQTHSWSAAIGTWILAATTLILPLWHLLF